MSKPTPALVVAVIALFVALGGTGYAALKLPKNSVRSTQIASGAVGSSEVKNRSLRISDFARGARGALRGPQGPAGANGINGTKGTDGATNVVVRKASKDVADDNVNGAVAACQAGERATGGGASWVGGAWDDVYIVRSEPTVGNLGVSVAPGQTATSWSASGKNLHATDTDARTLNVWVICASP